MKENISSENIAENTEAAETPFVAGGENSAPEADIAAPAPEAQITVSDALKKIEDAEERALKIREDAKIKAREISKSAAEECEAIKAEYASETKREIAAIMADANAIADKAELEAKKAVEQSSRDAVKSAEKNVRSVGEWLADMLVKGKY